MASGVAVRSNLYVRECRRRDRAGNLQQKRRHRCECGNSHGKLDHRTNAHVQLSNQPDNLNSTVSMLLADVVGSSVLSSETVYCWP